MKVDLHKILSTAIVLGVLLVLVLAGMLGKEALRLGAVSPSLYTLTPDTILPDISFVGTYTNRELGFSLSLPKGYKATEMPADMNGSLPIIIQNEQGEGIQILATKDAGDVRELSESDIQQSIPDMAIRAVEQIEIGDTYKGVAFLSDNEAFDGNSREVWFYFRGTLYQISTYARLDGLLKAIFSTWKFF